MEIKQAEYISKLLKTKEEYRRNIETLNRILGGDLLNGRPNDNQRFNVCIEDSFTISGSTFRIREIEFEFVVLMIETVMEAMDDEMDNIDKKIKEI